jgi:hypothetical protein
MADETVTSLTRLNTGSKKGFVAAFTSSGTSGDVFVGLRRIKWATISHVNGTAAAVNIQLNINSKTVDVDNESAKEGWVHYDNATSSRDYELYAEGY